MRKKRQYEKYTYSEMHDPLAEKLIPDDYYGKEIVVGQALTCPYHVPLTGILGADWGVIVNPMSPRFGQVVFEHDRCACWNHKDIYGNQSGTNWIKKEKK